MTTTGDDIRAISERWQAEGIDITSLDPDAGPLPGCELSKPGDKRWLLANVKRQRFLEAFRADPFNLDAACEAVGWTRQNYSRNRQLDREFARRVDGLRGSSRGRPSRAKAVPHLGKLLKETVEELHERTGGIDRLPDLPDVEQVQEWGGFAGFRKVFFGHDTPWFHNEIVDVLENRAKPGSVTLILVPPYHGKSTLLEDWINFKLAIDPSYRIVAASEKQGHARKLIKRVKGRMHPDGPCPEYVRRFGPFIPQKGDDAHDQPWNQDYFDVWRRGSASDERDYNMVGLGMGSAVAGTRCDLLVVDDAQSLKSLNLTDKLLDEFRQDWLSRPGAKGRTVIIGTRVGPGDFYERLLEEDLVDNLIRYPAYDGTYGWLWPEQYSPEDYALLRKQAGESAWARNYMQRPTAAGDQTFTDEDLQACSDKLHRFGRRPDHIEGLSAGIIGWDPGFGTNALYYGGITKDRLVDLDWRTDHGLSSTAQMAQIIDDLCAHWMRQGVRPAHLVVEDKAFQHGLLRDEAVLELSRKYGFSISGHQTSGASKLDDDLGVAAMARSFRMGEIVMPGADDPDTQRARAAMDAELRAWRPNVRGSKLRMDLVMARWFAWMRWRAVREMQHDRSHVIRRHDRVAGFHQFRPRTLAGAR